MMTYFIYIKTAFKVSYIQNIDKNRVDKIVDAYLYGKTTFTLSGKEYSLSNLKEIRIFDVDKNEQSKKPLQSFDDRTPTSRQGISFYGNDVTYDFIGDEGYGSKTEILVPTEKTVIEKFISETRITELSSIKSEQFDLTKLIQYSKELNDNYANGNYLSIAMLGRAIIDHIPPIFQKQTFTEVANNIAGKSVKQNLQNLENSFRKIADGHLHSQITKKEVLPTEAQIKFMPDMDVLLGEIVRVLK